MPRSMCPSTWQWYNQAPTAPSRQRIRKLSAGPMVFVLVEDDYVTREGRPILRCTNTQVMR